MLESHVENCIDWASFDSDIRLKINLTYIDNSHCFHSNIDSQCFAKTRFVGQDCGYTMSIKLKTFPRCLQLEIGKV